jgi:predicted MFS family arabinose efflux permease
VLLMGLVGFSGMHVSIMYGTWLHAEYSLGAVRLGLVALVIGVADLSGSVLVSLAGDHLGRRATLLLGIVGSLAAYSLLPFLNRGLIISVAGIMAFRLCFEVSTVACAPLLSELATRQRGKAFAVGLLSGSAGYSVAGLTGPAAYASHGVLGLGMVSATTSVVSLVVLLFMIRMPSRSKHDEGLILTPESGTSR